MPVQQCAMQTVGTIKKCKQHYRVWVFFFFKKCSAITTDVPSYSGIYTNTRIEVIIVIWKKETDTTVTE